MDLSLLDRPPRPFDPRQLYGLQLWLDAEHSARWQDSARTTPAAADTDPVGAWNDLSGRNNHGTQATAGSRPTLRTNVLNGRPVLRFDGGDLLTLAANVGVTTSTVIAVANRTAGALRAILSAQRIAVYSEISGGEWGAFLNTSLASGQSSTATHAIWSTVIRAANDVDFVTNGANLVTRTGSSSYQNRGTTAVGADASGAQYHTGDIAALLVWNRALLVHERQRVERWLGQRFGITVA